MATTMAKPSPKKLALTVQPLHPALPEFPKQWWLARVRELTHVAIDAAALRVAQAETIEAFDPGPADEMVIRSLTIGEVARHAAATPLCPLCLGSLTGEAPGVHAEVLLTGDAPAVSAEVLDLRPGRWWTCSLGHTVLVTE